MSLSALLARAQTPILLNINSSTYPTVCSVANYQVVGVAGLTGSESISQVSPAFNVALTSPITFTNGGQVMYLSDTSNGGTWVKSSGAGATNGLMDCYFYTTTAAARTMTVSNLNLTPGTNYTLYLIGTIPVSDAAEDGLFQPINTPNITFTSTASGHGVVGFPFTTSAAYSNANVLQFTWGKSSSGNGTFQGLAIVPGVASQTQTLMITNGVQKYASLTSKTVTMSGRCELWVTSSLAPIFGCIINLNSTDSWLFLPNTKPAIAVQPTYLGRVRINGAAAVADSNCRVVQYGQNGAVVLPHPSSFQPLTAYTGAQFTGTPTPYSQWTYYTGTGITNISSFKLKRGYQAVLAQSANGANYSKCYVAQDGDLEIGALPNTLDKKIQFIYVTPWRWAPKKGLAGDPGIPQLNIGSWYNWNISASSSRNVEYDAIRQQPYWPGLGQNWQALGINTVLGYNEPDNSSQDAYKNLNPPGSISDAVARLPDQLATGLRVGSPATTDGGRSGWLYPFVSQADAAGYRVDFIAIHYYWAWNPADPSGAANQMYNFLLNIWNNTHRPIWITEWNNGANWTDNNPYPPPTYAQQQACISAMINMLENTPFVERYHLYNWVEDVRSLVDSSGNITAAGITYRDLVSNLSYSQTMPDNGTPGIAEFLFATNAWDSSGYCNNGMTVGAPSFTTGHNSQAQAIILDGANSYVQLPANIARGNGFTFAGWVNWNGGGAWQRIFDFGNDMSHYLFLTPNSGSGTLRFTINNGGGEQIVERSGALASGSWQHVAVTLNGSTAILYVNGTQAGSASVTITPSAFSPIKNYLGKSQFPADPDFNGKLDQLEIANYAMTGAQISALYNSAQFPVYSGGVWTNNADGNWSTINNWSSGIVANGSGFVADFGALDITANRTVTLDSPRTIGGLKFADLNGSQTWTLSGANTLTLDAGAGNVPTIGVGQSAATISTLLAGTSGFTKNGIGTLTLSGTNNLGGGLTVNAGTVNISGGSTAFGSGTSTVGYLYGSGNLTMTGGSLTVGGELRVGGSDQSGSQYVATGALTVANATLSVGALTVARGNHLDNSMSGSVTLNSGGQLISTNDVILEFAGSGLGKLVVNGGTFILGPSATKWLMVGFYDTGAGELDINNGSVFLENSSSLKMCRAGNTGGNMINQMGGNVTFFSDAGVTIGGGGNLDLSYAGGISSSSVYNLKGGTLTVPQVIASSTTGNSTFNFNGGTLKPTAGTAAFMQGLTAARVMGGGVKIDTAGFNITIAQALMNGGGSDGGLTKNGIGTLTLTGTNTYTGNTAVNAGTLALTQATLATSSIVNIASGAKLQLDFTTTNRIRALVLNGVTQPPGVYNSSTTASFLSSTGSLQVPIATNPTNVTFTTSGGELTLSWPTDHTGWRLQSQTNTLATGLSTNWFDVVGSTATNAVSLPVDASNGSVFYRLVYP